MTTFSIPNSKLFLIVLPLLLLNNGCGPKAEIGPKLEGLTGQSPANVLAQGAMLYALANLEALHDDRGIEKSGVELRAGDNYGHSMRPRADQLVELGYLPRQDVGGVSSGSVKLVFEPAGCNKSGAKSCRLAITTRLGRYPKTEYVDVAHHKAS